MAESIEDLRHRRNLASLVAPHSVMHINGRRRRRGTIRPISAAEGVPAFRRTLSASRRLASATHSSKPPLVCASVNRIWHVSSVCAQSTRTVAALRLSRLPCGTQPRFDEFVNFVADDRHSSGIDIRGDAARPAQRDQMPDQPVAGDIGGGAHEP